VVQRPEPEGPHVEVALPEGNTLASDTEEVIAGMHPGWSPPTGPGRVAIAFGVKAPRDVDVVFRRLTAAGLPGTLTPFDAPWGQRYASVRLDHPVSRATCSTVAPDANAAVTRRSDSMDRGAVSVPGERHALIDQFRRGHAEQSRQRARPKPWVTRGFSPRAAIRHPRRLDECVQIGGWRRRAVTHDGRATQFRRRRPRSPVPRPTRLS
jgi:hypothetical protein